MSVLPFDQRDGFIWLNGALVPWKDAQLHVLSHGLHYGSSVFEGERAYGGKIFKITEHSERFRASAEVLDFEIPYSVAELDAAKQLVVEKNNFQSCYVRPVAWRGSEMMAVAAQHATIHVAIAVWDWPSMFDVNEKMRGIRLDIAEYRRPDPLTAPCKAKAAGLYMICTISKHRAERRGFAAGCTTRFCTPRGARTRRRSSPSRFAPRTCTPAPSHGPNLNARSTRP